MIGLLFLGCVRSANNWSAHAVEIWGRKFPTVEHAYHYRKFSGAAPKAAAAILDAPSPLAAMKIERTHRIKGGPIGMKSKSAL